MLIDSHCHLDRLDLSPYDGKLDLAIDAAVQRGVSHLLCIGIDMANAPIVLGIAEQYENVMATVGVHPLDVAKQHNNESTPYSRERLKALADSPKVVAIGETGLDYYYDKDNLEIQQVSFIEHLQLAKDIAKPLVVHTRDAKEDTLRLIKQHGCLEKAGVLHCFTESLDMAKAALDLNYYISFSGIITFKNAAELREVVKAVPLDRILVETDSPYLAPVPYRGKKNEPQYVVEVAKCVAELKGISYEELAEQTTENFCQLFNAHSFIRGMHH